MTPDGITTHFDKLPARVLVVEDDRGYAEMLRETLNSNVIKIVGVAFDARTAMAMWDEMQPDALITDLALPGPYDGVNVIEHAREKDPDAIIIALTGTQDEDLAQRASAAGAQAVFQKQEYPPVRREMEHAIQERNGVTYE